MEMEPAVEEILSHFQLTRFMYSLSGDIYKELSVAV
jgi:hypothetical protein